MKLVCGPAHDKRTLEIMLPPGKQVGVFISGGIDSALLYYLLVKENQNHSHNIQPLVIARKEGSRYFARPIIERINQLLGIDIAVKRVGNTSLPEPQQVTSAVEQAFRLLKLEEIFIGLIYNRPEHTVGFDPIPVPEMPYLHTPFRHLEKSHIIDIYYQLGIQSLLEHTHSCDQSETTQCRTCNGCKERAWGFAELSQTDPRL
jgi:hypothetical protein